MLGELSSNGELMTTWRSKKHVGSLWHGPDAMTHRRGGSAGCKGFKVSAAEVDAWHDELRHERCADLNSAALSTSRSEACGRVFRDPRRQSLEVYAEI